MPTIQQLPAAVQPSASDELPVSQGGVTRAVSVGELLAATQSAITTASNTLLGRVSLGPGGPEPVPMGVGLAIAGGALSANGGDHAGFVQRNALTLSDEVVLNSSGTPSRMPLPMLRGLFASGTNVSIDGSGTISAATDPAIVTSLGTVGAQAAAAQSASGSAMAVAGTLAVNVSTLGSQVGMLSSAVAPLGGQIGTLSASVSSVGSLAAAASSAAASAGSSVSTLGSTVAEHTAQIGTLSASVSSAGSLAAAASSAAASAGSSVSTLGSQVGTLSSAVAPLGGQIGTLSATVSSVGSTVAGNTAQIGTLSASVSSVGSLAAAASSAATSASSSVSTLGSTVAGHTAQIGTLSASVSSVGSLAAAASSAAASAGSSVSTLGSTVAGNTAQIGTLSASVSSVGSLAAAASSAATSAGSSVSTLGSTVAGNTAQIGTLSASVSSVGSLAAAASSAAASAGSSVSTLGSTVGTLSSAVAAGIIAGASTAGSTTTLTNSSGGTIATIVAPQGPPGTLGNGSVRGNTASAAQGGPERTLQAIHSDRLRLRMFGAQQNGTTAQSLLGVTTRAALAAWTNPAGATPYAFAATQPFTMGDDYWLRLPSAVASGSAVALAATLKLASAGYQGQDGHWYLPAPNAGSVYYDDMVVSGGALAAGTKVVATQGGTIRITDQAAGTAIPAGTVLTIGADMSRVKVGQQVWATQGLAPLCSITAISGTTITLSAPLASAGLSVLQTLNVYTPMAEASLTNSITMDMVAFCAAYAACPYGGVVECDPGDYAISPHVILAGRNVSFVGTGARSVYLHGTDNAPLIKMFPQPGSTPDIRNLSFASYTGNPQTFLEIDGGGYSPFAQNSAPCRAQIDNISGYVGSNSSGYVGAYELVRLRNLGNVRFDNVDFIGLGKTVVGACTLNAGGVVLMLSRNVTSHYCWRAAIQQGYIEDPICEHWAQDQCGGAWDASRANTYNGICGLLFKWIGGDNDVTDFILNLPSFSGVNISDADVIFNGQNGGACYILAGCASGVISGVQGGTQSPGVVDCIHLTSAMVDGGYYPSINILVQAVGVAGFDCAVRIDKGCSGNDVTATLWSAGTGSVNGISPAPVIDSDGRNRINGVMGTAH